MNRAVLTALVISALALAGCLALRPLSAPADPPTVELARQADHQAPASDAQCLQAAANSPSDHQGHRAYRSSCFSVSFDYPDSFEVWSPTSTFLSVRQRVLSTVGEAPLGQGESYVGVEVPIVERVALELRLWRLSTHESSFIDVDGLDFAYRLASTPTMLAQRTCADRLASFSSDSPAKKDARAYLVSCESGELGGLQEVSLKPLSIDGQRGWATAMSSGGHVVVSHMFIPSPIDAGQVVEVIVPAVDLQFYAGTVGAEILATVRFTSL